MGRCRDLWRARYLFNTCFSQCFGSDRLLSRRALLPIKARMCWAAQPAQRVFCLAIAARSAYHPSGMGPWRVARDCPRLAPWQARRHYSGAQLMRGHDEAGFCSLAPAGRPRPSLIGRGAALCPSRRLGASWRGPRVRKTSPTPPADDRLAEFGPRRIEVSRTHWERNSPRCLPVCPGLRDEARQGPTPGRGGGTRGARGAAAAHQGRDGGGGASATAETAVLVLANLERHHRGRAASADRHATSAGTPSHIATASAKGSLEGDQHHAGQPSVWGCVTRGGCRGGERGREERTERWRSSRLGTSPSRGRGADWLGRAAGEYAPTPSPPSGLRIPHLRGGGMAFALGACRGCCLASRRGCYLLFKKHDCRGRVWVCVCAQRCSAAPQCAVGRSIPVDIFPTPPQDRPPHAGGGRKRNHPLREEEERASKGGDRSLLAGASARATPLLRRAHERGVAD